MSAIHEKIITEIFGLYMMYGHADYIGEPLSQIEHMSQAATLAIREGHSDEVVLAAFFHDIGHICEMSADARSMGGYGIKRHEQIGADFLRSRGFPEIIPQLVENHVQAKRYLTFRYPAYYNELSEASRKTLDFQGGIMNEREAIGFENHPFFELSIKMRRWDDLAKETNIPLINTEILKEKARKVLRPSRR